MLIRCPTDNASPTDPSELTFARGEVLEIFDKSGKWWEAMKSNGARGSECMLFLTMMI